LVLFGFLKLLRAQNTGFLCRIKVPGKPEEPEIAVLNAHSAITIAAKPLKSNTLFSPMRSLSSPLVYNEPVMTVAHLKIGRKAFVVIPEADFVRLQRESDEYRKSIAEDHILGRLAEKELKAFRKRGSKGTPWKQVKSELGL
jgi:PHD/YefM family antitoxin component YafN of YafNO toxin-antitoxin module